MATTKRAVAEKIPAAAPSQEVATTTEKKQLAIYPTKASIELALANSEKLKAIRVKIANYQKDIAEAKITSDVTAKMVDNNVAEAKKYSKELAEAGKNLRSPYTMTASNIKAFYDELTAPLDAIVEAGQKAVLSYQRTQQQAAAAKALKAKQQNDNLIKWVEKATSAIKNSSTLAELEKEGKAFFAEYDDLDVTEVLPDVVNTAVSSIKALGKERYTGLKNGSIVKPDEQDLDDPDSEQIDQTEIGSVVAAQSIAEKMKEASDHAIVVAAPVTKFSTKTTKTVAYAPFKREEDVDKRFMSIDPAKVKAFLAENRDSIKKHLDAPGVTEGYVAGGLRFYYEEGVRTN